MSSNTGENTHLKREDYDWVCNDCMKYIKTIMVCKQCVIPKLKAVEATPALKLENNNQ